MATDISFMEFVADQIRGAGVITYRKMFGEYAVYCDGKVVALVCDNQLFVKPTAAGRNYVGDVELAPPYPGAKQHFHVSEKLDDPEWLSELIRITAEELPTGPIPGTGRRRTRITPRPPCTPPSSRRRRV